MQLYPENDQEFAKMFKTEEDCLEYLISIRWPDGSPAVQFVLMTSSGAITMA
jgi:hypothetical protein